MHNKKTYWFSLLRVCVVVLVALLLPRYFISENAPSQSAHSASLCLFKLGLENISDSFLKNLVKPHDVSYRVGLITNHTGIDQTGRRNIDVLRARNVCIKKIYVPGTVSCPFDSVCKKIDSQTQIPIVSLPILPVTNNYEYVFDDIDVLFFDLQDIGVRPSKCLDVLCTVLKSAAHQHKKVVILDRPNLLGGSMEGIVACDKGPALPLQYGMTIGELAQYVNAHMLKDAASLHVVPMAHYDRNSALDGELYLKRPLLTNIDIGGGLSFLEIVSLIQPLDVGLGTDMALQCILLPEEMRFPKQKWFELRCLLKECGIQASLYRCFNAAKHQRYQGLRLMVKNTQKFSPFATLLSLVEFFRAHGISLTYGPDFDDTLGNTKVREFLQGKISRDTLEQEVNKGLKYFFTNAQRSFLYKPYPKVMFL